MVRSEYHVIRWITLVGLLACFVLLQRALWMTTSSVPHGWALAAQVSKQKQENARLREKNARSWAEVKDLQKGGGAIEEQARMNLGLVKKGETFYQIVRIPPAAPHPPSSSVSPAAAATHPGG